MRFRTLRFFWDQKPNLATLERRGGGSACQCRLIEVKVGNNVQNIVREKLFIFYVQSNHRPVESKRIYNEV